MKKTISEIKKWLQTGLTEVEVASLRADSRKGVQRLVAQYDRLQEKKHHAQEAFERRLVVERRLWQAGDQYVAGIDEVGRGPLAGPVVAAAVILPHNFNLVAVNDSKQLSAALREQLYGQILSQAVAVAIGTASNKLIDRVNIYEATRIAMGEAVNHLVVTPTHLIVDAMQVPVTLPQERLIKGDAKSASVAAASIVAKVVRDRLMSFYDEVYPGYGFEQNAGYGTKEHLAGLDSLGVTPIHRRTFAPVAKRLSK
ncbi:ribonuclease HII [Ligilactobacillus sp. LYQ139]|uniref:ribonuclease HII n=1 Tax=Ligilactobacillus sp. LYQ139 TaxID=3378800 RepID=UPI00385502D2